MRWLKTIAGLVAATVLAALGLLLVLFIWSGAGDSLSATLALASRHLPDDQTLEVKDVRGTLRAGGRIGWLRWRRGELSVEARDAELAWTLRGLLDGQVRLSRLAIGHLTVDDRRTPGPVTAPTDLRLPLRVDTPFNVNVLDWTGPGALHLTNLSGRYVFDSLIHSFYDGNVHFSSGKYQFFGTMQAQGRLALSLDLRGKVLTTVPGSHQTLTVLASAAARGQLAGADATLALAARLVPDPTGSSSGSRSAPGLTATTSQTMQASVSASIRPWQAQPVVSAQAQWQALNLAALWPQAPSTLLQGQATVTPQAVGWQAEVQLVNALSGPLDQQRLPVQSLKARAAHAGGQWGIESLDANAAGGHLQARGQRTGSSPATGSTAARADPTWEGQAKFQGINPAALDSRLAAAVLDGRLGARLEPQGLEFEAQFQPSPGSASTAGSGAKAVDRLRLKTVQATGRWSSPMLTLHALQLQTDDARLWGHGTYQTLSQAAEGRLNLSLPGAEAALAGQISSATGQGELTLRAADAALASQWLSRWPGLPGMPTHTTLQGSGDLTAHWQGGWQRQGELLQIQAVLTSPGLTLRTSGSTPARAWRISDLQASADGSLGAMRLTTRVGVDAGTRRVHLRTQAQAGRHTDGVWHASVESARLDAQDSQQPGTWTLELEPGVRVDWVPGASPGMLGISAGQARLTGPAPGAARLAWAALRVSGRASGGAEWRTQGEIEGLPLAWLALIGGSPAGASGLSGDMVLAGQWDVAASDRLRVRASLARTQGDLWLQAEGESAPTLNAGVREARVALTSDGEALDASLRWDSERAGQIQADFATRLQSTAGGWSWAADTPVRGTVRAQLPRVGVWSMLAPPGWRLRGTLDAQATLTGTRAAPQWRGTLQASDLTVRSVADGIEFSQGTLRASLNGQRLDIDEFTLRGASAAGGTGGLLRVTGQVLWPPTDGNSTLARLRMELDATAEGLRVSARADRRLAVSGRLSARLENARLVVRGALKADQALFIVPEDTAPSLGTDVVIKPLAGGARTSSSTKTLANAYASATATATAATPAAVHVTPDIAISLDLGPDFQLRGRGLVTRLAGNPGLSTLPGTLKPRLTGEIRTAGGTYRAYGQLLDIEEGVLRFAGPYDNPALDIRAIRPNLTQRVGVQISGNVLAPRVRLYSEPELPESEKLAWLVLGRSAAGGGAESAVLQQAALALLGGNGQGLPGGLAQALNLDELSVRGATSNTDGTASGATVTLGKRLSRNFYVAYERSLIGTLGTFHIFYDLSRRFTLRAQTGEQSAVDLIFTMRYD